YPGGPLPPVTHTHALFADQSHSIPDNLMTLLRHHRAWNSSAETTPSALALIRRTAGSGCQADRSYRAPGDLSRRGALDCFVEKIFGAVRHQCPHAVVAEVGRRGGYQ